MTYRYAKQCVGDIKQILKKYKTVGNSIIDESDIVPNWYTIIENDGNTFYMIMSTNIRYYRIYFETS